MLFSSMTFIYVFLPSVLSLYFLVRENFRNYILLVASMCFYGWAEPKYLVIMLLTIIVSYSAAILTDKYRQFSGFILLISILILLSILLYFKYFNFFVDIINTISRSHFNFIEVIMPIGISFYTFQSLSYLVDVYRGDANVQRDFFKLALYISLFPQLVAGPIVKYHDIDEQISQRKVTLELFSAGVQRFIIGLGKKVIIANNLGIVADKVFSLPVEQVDVLTSWIGAVAYSLQLFFDFSGYSDMAIGLGLMFGFRFLENFNYPYISRSITEFWRRWHISLSTWFKQYLYIPLGGNRVSKSRHYLNLWIVFFCTGFWHGAAWNFIVWGLWHGLFIVWEKWIGWNFVGKGLFNSLIHRLYTLGVVLFGWVLFRATDLTHAMQYIKNMFGFVAHTDAVSFGATYFYDRVQVVCFVVALLISTPVMKIIDERYKSWIVYNALHKVYLLIVLLLSTVALATSTYNPFIYFRF